MGVASDKVLQALQRLPVAAPTWLSGFVVGLFSALSPNREQRRAQNRHRFVAGWKRSLAASIEDEPPLQQDPELFSLRQSLIDLPRAMVATLLGNPPSAFFSQSHSAAPAGAHWHADIWYYPTDLKRCTALAIFFDGDRVSHVERVLGPVV